MDREPIRTNIRRIRRGFDPEDACVFCGYPNPVALMRKGREWAKKHCVARTLLERHHPAGKNHFPDLTIIVCRNCHAEAHEGLLQEGVRLSREANPHVWTPHFFKSMAVLFEKLAEIFRNLQLPS